MSLSQQQGYNDILHLSFNQDNACFSVGLGSGFRVFTTEPFSESVRAPTDNLVSTPTSSYHLYTTLQPINLQYRREFPNGGVGIVEMLFRSNILALVGGGHYPKFPTDKVMIWDDNQGRCIGEINFRTPVRAVRLRRDRIAVALEHKVLVYTLEDLRQVYTEETMANPDGLLALSPSPDIAVLAYPGTSIGQVRVKFFNPDRPPKNIAAHDSKLHALSLSTNGKFLATASEKGTIIRVFSTIDGTKLRELRRGTAPARIYSIAFSRGERPEWLAATSDNGTVHVFGLSSDNPASGGGGMGSGGGSGGGAGSQTQVDMPSSSPSRNTLAAIAAIGRRLPVGGQYFSSDRSVAQHRLPDTLPSVVAFGKEPNTLLVITKTGAFHKLRFDIEKGGPWEQLAYRKFMEDSEHAVPRQQQQQQGG